MVGPRSVLATLVGTAAGVAERILQPADVLFDEIGAQARTLDEVHHRPWALPPRPWLMGQTWRDLLFAHWEVAAEDLEPLVPSPLELDDFEGGAWLGVTPFEVTGLRPRGAPPPPLLSSFGELNVRTYVRFGGRPGILFFSLDCSSAAAVVTARRGYRLPYFHAEASLERHESEIRFSLERASGEEGGPVSWRGRYRPAGPPLPVTDGTLERWLTERYCLYVVSDGRVLRGEIHHPPWPLQPASAEIEENTMARPLGVQLRGEPLLHFARRQDTLLWALAQVG